MYIVTLLTSPKEPCLDRTLVASIRNAWGGGDIGWLSPDEAVEFPVADILANRWDIWHNCQAMGVDLIVQPVQGRRKKMLLADMDCTMTQQECIDELADAAGVGAHVRDITARAMNGELDFVEALQERVQLLKGLTREDVANVLETRITYMPGGAVLLATMKAQGAYAALVSGGFSYFTESVADALGFDEQRANTLLFEDGKLTGKVGHPILGRQAKIEALEEITARLGIAEADVIAVGDGANDLGMLARAGTGVALHAKPAVATECDVRVNHGDLTALLYLQGYARDEFVDA